MGKKISLHLGDVLLLAHPDRSLAPSVEELPDDRLLAGEQLLAGAEHRQLAAEEQAEVVRHRAGRADVVGDDQEGRVDLRVQVDDQLVEVGHAHRVEAGVRLVEQDDLGVEHQRPGDAGALAHAAGDLAGQLPLGTGQADHVHLLEDDAADLGLALLGVLAQREGDVVVEVHRAEQRAVLEQHAEEPAHVVELALTAGDDVGVGHDDRPALGLEQPHQRLQEDRLAGAGRAEHHRDLTGRQRQGDIAPDVLAAEGLGQTLDVHRDAHLLPPRAPALLPVPRMITVTSHGSVRRPGPSRDLLVGNDDAGERLRGSRPQRDAGRPPGCRPVVADLQHAAGAALPEEDGPCCAVRWCGSPVRPGRGSLDGDGRAGALEGGLGLLGGVLGDLLQDRLRRVVDQVLGLLEAERGQAAHLLDDLDLLVAGSLEDDVELVLLDGGLSGTATATTGGGGSDGHGGSRGDVEGLLELLHEVRQLQEGHLLERVEQLVRRKLGHGSLLQVQSVLAAVSAAASVVSGVVSAAASAAGASADFFSCSAAARRATWDSGAWNSPAALVWVPFSAPASLASRTSRGSTSARRVTSAASTVRPSTTPPLTTSSGLARAKSRMALAASTGSPSMKAIAVGPLSSGARSEKPTDSAARFVRVFLTTA